jgi:uncharacterized protein
MYEAGMSMPQNYAEAIKWWRRSADQGYGPAQFSLGLAYAYGEGVTQDFLRAYVAQPCRVGAEVCLSIMG